MMGFICMAAGLWMDWLTNCYCKHIARCVVKLDGMYWYGAGWQLMFVAVEPWGGLLVFYYCCWRAYCMASSAIPSVLVGFICHLCAGYLLLYHCSTFLHLSLVWQCQGCWLLWIQQPGHWYQLCFSFLHWLPLVSVVCFNSPLLLVYLLLVYLLLY
jgi:hypothetical protein